MNQDAEGELEELIRQSVQGELEELIRNSVRGRTAMGQFSVADILLEADYWLRFVPDRIQLDTALRHLVSAGHIRQTSEGAFVDGRSGFGSTTYQALEKESHQASVDEYTGVNRSQPGEATGAAPTEPVLIATIPTSAPTASRAEWRKAEAIAILIRNALQAQRRRSAVPIIYDRAGHLEFTVLATVNDDPRRAHRLLAAVFAAVAPTGSELKPIVVPLP